MTRLSPSEFRDHSVCFAVSLDGTRMSADPGFLWYPFFSLSNVKHLAQLLGPTTTLLDPAGDQPVLDLGCADGNLAFVLESFACSVNIRAAARSGRLTGPTCGLAPGYLQANLVVLPEPYAADFLEFCRLNPKPCPLLEVTAPGIWEPRQSAPRADLRTDVPKYRVYRHGALSEEVTDITHLWRNDLVAFLLGCSFSFEAAMLRAGLPLRHLELGSNVPMFRTNIPCTPAGSFSGPLVVSMRPLTPAQAIEAIVITSRFPLAHGAPVHFGDPAAIGISDLARPGYGDPVPLLPGEVPVFWACGVTPQAVLMEAKPEFAITHSPGCMFVTDHVADNPAG